MSRARFIAAARYRRPMYGSNHPLAIPRVSLTQDLIAAYDALRPEEFVTARKAADAELQWFHTAEYVNAFKCAETLGRVAPATRARHALGTLENPYFPQFFSTPATAAGASIQAAEAVLGGRIGFNPAGGMHHARADRAQGFCFFNDPVLGILRLKRAGLRVLYVDIDAHHGDGVEEAFLGDADVFTLSLHMDTAYAYPYRGGRFRDSAPQAAYTSLNLPLPRGTTDAEYRLVWQEAFPRVLDKFRPDAVFLLAGTDAIGHDPLGKLALTTQGWLAVCADVLRDAPRHADGRARLLVTGGGGYHPLAVARAWTGLWGLLSGRTLPAALPAEGAAALKESGWDLDEDEAHFAQFFMSRLDADPPPAPLRPEIAQLARAVAEHPYFRRT